MHELHLAQDILKKIREKMEEKGITEVTSAKIALGQLRFTHLEELREIFADISRGIKLEIEIIPLKTACADCKAEFDPSEMRLDCPHCGSMNLKVASGNELLIRELHQQ